MSPVVRASPQRTSPRSQASACSATIGLSRVLRGDSSWISGDYLGWLRKVLRERLGCTVAVGTGCAGDSNPRWRGSTGDLERVAACISGPVLDKTAALSPEPLRRLWAASKVMRMRLVDLPGLQEARALAGTAAREWEVDTSPWLSTVTRQCEQRGPEISLDMEVQLVRINGGFLAGVPMEPFSEIALDVLVAELYRESQAAVTPGGVRGASQ